MTKVKKGFCVCLVRWDDKGICEKIIFHVGLSTGSGQTVSSRKR